MNLEVSETDQQKREERNPASPYLAPQPIDFSPAEAERMLLSMMEVERQFQQTKETATITDNSNALLQPTHAMSDEEYARFLAKQFEDEESALASDEGLARQLQEMEERERQRQRQAASRWALPTPAHTVPAGKVPGAPVPNASASFYSSPPSKKKAPKRSKREENTWFDKAGDRTETEKDNGSSKEEAEEQEMARTSKQDEQHRNTTELYICPICQEGGLTEIQLLPHTLDQHPNVGIMRLVCPICAAQPGGNPNFKSRDYVGHLGLRHKGNSSLSSFCFHEASSTPEGYTPGLSSALRQRKRTHLITRSARGFRLLSSRSMETLWEYLLHADIDTIQLPPCMLCSRRVKPSHTRVVLPCGHHFHAQCIPASSSLPACPMCSSFSSSSGALSSSDSESTIRPSSPYSPVYSPASPLPSSPLSLSVPFEAPAFPQQQQQQPLMQNADDEESKDHPNDNMVLE